MQNTYLNRSRSMKPTHSVTRNPATTDKGRRRALHFYQLCRHRPPTGHRGAEQGWGKQRAERSANLHLLTTAAPGSTPAIEHAQQPGSQAHSNRGARVDTSSRAGGRLQPPSMEEKEGGEGGWQRTYWYRRFDARTSFEVIYAAAAGKG